MVRQKLEVEVSIRRFPPSAVGQVIANVQAQLNRSPVGLPSTPLATDGRA
jgi:hypothetical protein